MSKLFPVVLVFAATAAFGAESKGLGWPESQSLPPWVHTLWRQFADHQRYVLSTHVNPFYQRGDFDGDGETDVAVLARETSTDKQGIVVLHRGSGAVLVLGAGREVGNGGDDFRWMDAWHVAGAGELKHFAAPPDGRQEALYVQKTESASALLYWDGERYVWHQLGD